MNKDPLFHILRALRAARRLGHIPAIDPIVQSLDAAREALVRQRAAERHARASERASRAAVTRRTR